ncbi:hypothetical protein CROQUDRAFT_131837 [Cronartium quercuum f. sp. fusiforme G11]|uniref:Uncharacterized protein n=1 Tax=Cronartium quercuum f. sp. fusiforme G11 TaxID=708437 RepID=A0A9P6NN61_9BASI|nr:hypothetical protein CROQUDRAFT_131837 [Cronartium quercuum f. sp. fusiforme G11]
MSLRYGEAFPRNESLSPLTSSGRKRIPDEARPFIISWNGINTVSELIYGMQELLDFGLDLATILVVTGLKTSIDITTLLMSISSWKDYSRQKLTTSLRSMERSGTPTPTLPTEKLTRSTVIGGLHIEILLVGDLSETTPIIFSLVPDIQIPESRSMWGRDDHKYNDCRTQKPDFHWVALLFTVMTSADADGMLLPPDVQSINTFFGFINRSFTQDYGRLPPGPDGYYYRRAVPLTVNTKLFLALPYYFQLAKEVMI